MCNKSTISQIKQLHRRVQQRKVMFKTADKSFGTDMAHVEVTEFGEHKFAKRESGGPDTTFYYYSGLDAERDFCQYMLKLGKVFSASEVAELGADLGYMTPDGLEYVPGDVMPNGGPGGPNCKHFWIRFRGKIVLTPAPTDRQIGTLVSKSVFN